MKVAITGKGGVGKKREEKTLMMWIKKIIPIFLIILFFSNLKCFAKPAQPEENKETVGSTVDNKATDKTFIINEELGFKMKAPRGWHLAEGPFNTTYRKYQNLLMPTLGVTMEALGPQASPMHSPLYFAEGYLSAYVNKLHDNALGAAEEIEINGIKGARIHFERVGEKKGSNVPAKVESMQYFFTKDWVIISIVIQAYSDDFKNVYSELQESINSLEIRLNKSTQKD